jgi:predicted alpha/beta hydrolase family esterase
MKKVLFLQSWYSHSTDNWYAWLEQELKKKGYTTCFPDLPEIRKDVPDMEVLMQEIEAQHFLDQDTIVVGHSLGCLLGMRLAEQYPFKELIIVSGWDHDDLTPGHALFWKSKLDHARIKENVKDIYVIHTDNDPYNTAISAQEMCERLGGKFILIKNGGHLTAKYGFTTLPQLLELF